MTHSFIHTWKQKLFSLMLIFSMMSGVALVPVLAFAAPGTSAAPAGTPSINNPLKDVGSLQQLVAKLINLLLQIAIPIAALFIMYAGFLFVSARGDAAQITKAKDVFKWTVIGAAVLLSSSLIVGLLQGTINKIDPNGGQKNTIQLN